MKLANKVLQISQNKDIAIYLTINENDAYYFVSSNYKIDFKSFRYFFIYLYKFDALLLNKGQ